MENAADALKMGAAILVFSIALVTVFSIFSQARQTSETVFQALDSDSYKEYIEGDRPEEGGSSYVPRIVGLETLIPILYDYKEEHYNVEILDASGDLIKKFQISSSDEEGGPAVSDEAAEKRVDDFIRDVLLEKYRDRKFREIYKEEIISGDISIDEETGETAEHKQTSTIVTLTYKVI